jgi:hypothetical protein
MYYRQQEVIPIVRELEALKAELIEKNDFVACCSAIDAIPGVTQSFIAWQSHMDEKRTKKMSGTWDTGIERTMNYRVLLYTAKGCYEATHASLRTALMECCDKLHLKFPEELE